MPSACANLETLPSKYALASAVFMDGDYGSAHMGFAIGNSYRGATLDCMATPGERIRALRKARGLTQPQLAAEVGIDQSTVSDIERGAGFSAETLMRLADALQSTPQEIMRGNPATSPALRKAQEAVKRLTDEERRDLLAVLEKPGIPDHEVEERIPVTKIRKRAKEAP